MALCLGNNPLQQHSRLFRRQEDASSARKGQKLRLEARVTVFAARYPKQLIPEPTSLLDPANSRRQCPRVRGVAFDKLLFSLGFLCMPLADLLSLKLVRAVIPWGRVEEEVQSRFFCLACSLVTRFQVHWWPQLRKSGAIQDAGSCVTNVGRSS